MNVFRVGGGGQVLPVSENRVRRISLGVTPRLPGYERLVDARPGWKATFDVASSLVGSLVEARGMGGQFLVLLYSELLKPVILELNQ